MGTYEVIDVNAIDRCVGFLRLAHNRYALVDREYQVTFH